MDNFFIEVGKQNDSFTLNFGTNQGAISYMNDGLITSHNCDFIKDKKFIKAYNSGKGTGSWMGSDIYWRAYVVCWAANYAKNLDGDFVECGVYKGGYSRAIIDYIEFDKLNKVFYLVDTFDGLDDELVTNEEQKIGISSKTYSYYKNAFNDVSMTFSKFNNVELVKGRIPEILNNVQLEKVSYLSIDMNCKVPEIAAIDYFWDKLVDGAIVVLDDYGFYNHIEQKNAFDEFAKSKDIEILTIPTGQGLIIKPNTSKKTKRIMSNNQAELNELLDTLNESINYLENSIEQKDDNTYLGIINDIIAGLNVVEKQLLELGSYEKIVEVCNNLNKKLEFAVNLYNEYKEEESKLAIKEFISYFYYWYCKVRNFLFS